MVALSICEAQVFRAAEMEKRKLRNPSFNFFLIILKFILGLPRGSDGKESTCNTGDLGMIPGLGRSPGGRQGKPLQYSCLVNPHGQRSLVGYSPWGHKESDMTEWLSTAQSLFHFSYYKDSTPKTPQTELVGVYMGRVFWMTIERCCSKFKCLLTSSSGSPYPRIYPTEVYTKVLKNVHSKVFLTALFVQKETGNLKCPSCGECMHAKSLQSCPTLWPYGL